MTHLCLDSNICFLASWIKDNRKVDFFLLGKVLPSIYDGRPGKLFLIQDSQSLLALKLKFNHLEDVAAW
jgi:hypothetical protein